MSPRLADTVDKVLKLKLFETMIQHSGLRRIIFAASAAHQRNSCAKFDGPDFFNSISHNQTAPPEGAEHRCKKVPSRDLLVDLVPDERGGCLSQKGVQPASAVLSQVVFKSGTPYQMTRLRIAVTHRISARSKPLTRLHMASRAKRPISARLPMDCIPART